MCVRCAGLGNVCGATTRRETIHTATPKCTIYASWGGLVYSPHESGALALAADQPGQEKARAWRDLTERVGRERDWEAAVRLVVLWVFERSAANGVSSGLPARSPAAQSGGTDARGTTEETSRRRVAEGGRGPSVIGWSVSQRDETHAQRAGWDGSGGRSEVAAGQSADLQGSNAMTLIGWRTRIQGSRQEAKQLRS